MGTNGEWEKRQGLLKSESKSGWVYQPPVPKWQPVPCHLVLLERWAQWGCWRQAGSGSSAVASVSALMNSPDSEPVARPAQGRAAAFPTYFPSGFTRGGSWASWGRPHVSWPNRPLLGGPQGPHHAGPSPSTPAWPGSRNHWVWCGGKGS